MEIGRRVYFDISTGDVLVDTGERKGSIFSTTIEQDISAYKVLSERVIGTYAYIELAFGQFAQDFMESNSYRINIDKIADLPFEEGYKALEFIYPDINDPEVPTFFVKPLTEQIASNMDYLLDVDFRLIMIELGMN